MKRLVIFTLVFGLISTFLLWEYKSEVNRFKINVQKYIELNISKNTGLQRSFLIFIQQIISSLPEQNLLTLDRSEADIGVSAKHIYPHPTPTTTTHVSTVPELIDALNNALGDSEIIIEAGVYRLTRNKIMLSRKSDNIGTSVLKAEVAGTVTLQLDSSEGLYIGEPNWIIENLIFEGVCDFDSYCDHAIHLVGYADNVVIQNNRFHNFNAAIKANGLVTRTETKREFPDNIKVLNNTFSNQWIRDTSVSVTPIDVVGGNYWLVKGNFIADFAKRRGNQVTYGVFLKGAGTNGMITDNIVACEWQVPHYSALDTRIGISLGGGGSDPSLCQIDGCPYEHKDGTLKSNVIINCQNDVGIYLNRASSTSVVENTILNTFGIDARFSETSGRASANQFQGKIRNRDGATLVFEGN